MKQSARDEYRPSPWLLRYAVAVAVCTALLVITGPAVSSNEARPLYFLGQIHELLGAAVSILMAGLAIWLARLKGEVWLGQLAWAALAANIVQDLLGLKASPVPAPLRVSHSLLGQVFFSTIVAIAVFASKSWKQNSKPVENRSSIPFLAMTTPVLILFQVALGVAFRHGVMGALPHILGALVLAAILGPTIAAILRIRHAEIRSVGIALILVGSLQMLLGFALLTMESLDIDPVVVIVATMAHAAMGAFTLAAATVIAVLIRRATWVAVARETGASVDSDGAYKMNPGAISAEDGS